MKVSDFFTKEEKERIVNAIRSAEHMTSGEIRVHIEKDCRGDVLDRAAYLFGKLGMHKTALRNGVLFYLAIHNKKFAILGDMGINQKVPAGFWENIRQVLENNFRENHFADGLEQGIRMAGEQLKAQFPYKADDKNELTDDISFG